MSDITRLPISALRRWVPRLAAGLLTLGLVACDSASPVAPPGTLLTISANPARIASNSTSEIRVVARKPNGTPVNPGTVVLLNTTVGQIPPSVPTNEEGEAITLLEGNGEFGNATITASVGGSESVTVEVQVGLPATAISLQATPTSVPETGGEIELLAQVRDDQGNPLPGATVNFTTETGTLESGGRFQTTGSDGAVTDLLSISPGDLDVIAGETFQVTVEVGSGTGSIVSDSTTLTIQRLPRADFTFTTSNLTVVFTDTSTGRPNRWLWDFGDGNTSQLQNPAQTYAGPGTFIVTLTATNSLGSDTRARPVTVTGN